MCFSATASFAVSGILAGVGITALAQTRQRSFRMLALIPILFAVQQAAEGLVWLTLASGRHTSLHHTAVYLFLGFALIVWPSWIPWSLLLLEEAPARRRLLRILVYAGGVVSTYATWLLLSWHPQVSVGGHSLRYDYPFSDWPVAQAAYLLAYMVPTVGPFFASTMKIARPMGVVFMIGLATALVMKRGALTSVWCFFAAVLSVLFAIAVVREQAAREPRLGQVAVG